jgi:hypothetical protein
MALLAKKRFPVLTLALCLAVSGALAVLLRLDYPAMPPDIRMGLRRVCNRRPETVHVCAEIRGLPVPQSLWNQRWTAAVTRLLVAALRVGDQTLAINPRKASRCTGTSWPGHT